MNDDNVVYVDFNEPFLAKLEERLSRVNEAIDELLDYIYEQEDFEVL